MVDGAEKKSSRGVGSNSVDAAVDTADLSEHVAKLDGIVEPEIFLKHELVEGSFLKALLVPAIYPMIVENSTNTVPWFQQICGVKPPPKEKGDEASSPRRGTRTGSDHAEAWNDPDRPLPIRVINFVLRSLFYFGAFLGSEGFYITVFPFIFWNVDEALGRRLMVFWGLSMYLGQYMKEHFQLPRPFVVSKKVRALGHAHWLAEYGFPSTHCMAVVGQASVLLLYVYKYCDEGFPVFYLSAALLFFVVITSAGRVYLGVHSVPDLVGGLIFHSLMFGLFLGIEDKLDDFITTNPASTWGSALFSLTLMLAYPRLKKFSSTFGDTAVIIGATNGVVMAQHHFHSKFTALRFSEDNWQPWLQLSSLRVLVGFLILVFVRLVVKHMMITFMLVIAGRNSKRPISERNEILVPTKLATYSAVGFSACTLAYMAFDFLNLDMVHWG